MSKSAETITRAYESYETQYGRGREMTTQEIQNRTDLTADQIKQGLREIALAGTGRPGTLGVAAGVIERM